MTAPPSSNLPLMQRFLQVAQTLQFAWFAGHLTLLFCIVRYGLSYLTFNYYSKWAQFTYRTAFISAAVTYGIVVYKGFRARARAGSKQSTAPLAIATDENVQYLAMALVWLYSSQYPLAMLPFGVYSVFHVLTYTRTNLIPTFMPSPNPNTPGKPEQANALANSIGQFVKQYYDLSMGVVAILEIALWGRLFLAAIIFTKGSWVLLTIYTAFLRARYAQSTFVQGSFRQVTASVDAAVGGQNIPPPLRQAWAGIKAGAKQFHDATDLNRYVQGTPAPAAKKAS